MTDVTAYRWIVEESYLQVAGCVTVVRGLDVAGPVLAFGGDPSVSPEPRERLLDLDGYIEVAAVGQLDDVVVAIEPNGFQGTRREVLGRASSNGMAASVFWNVNLLCSFSYAVEGDVVTSFDPLFTDQRSGSDPDRLLLEMATLPFGIGNDPIPAAFALVERLTGRALGRTDIDGITDVWRLVPLLDDLSPTQPEYHSLRHQHPELVVLVARAGSDKQREVAAVAAERAAAASGLDRESGVRVALAGLPATPGGPLSGEVAELIRQLLHRSSLAWSAVSIGQATETSEAYEISRSASAANALYRATNTDSPCRRTRRAQFGAERCGRGSAGAGASALWLAGPHRRTAATHRSPTSASRPASCMLRSASRQRPSDTFHSADSTLRATLQASMRSTGSSTRSANRR